MALPALVPDLRIPAPPREKVEAATEARTPLDNGEFALEWSTVSRLDFDGHLQPDENGRDHL